MIMIIIIMDYMGIVAFNQFLSLSQFPWRSECRELS